MNMTYKSIWSEEDFEQLNWHDVIVHAFSIIPREYDYELMLDIDYIFEWINPAPLAKHFSFVIAPATLSFPGAWDIKTDIATRKDILEPISILDIQRKNPRETNTANVFNWDWSIILEQGSIKFNGYGFKQYVRKEPLVLDSNVLEEEHRGVTSFSKTTYCA